MLNMKKFLATSISLAMAIVLMAGIAQAAVNLRPGYPPYDDMPGKLLIVDAGVDYPWYGNSVFHDMWDAIDDDLLVLGFDSERAIGSHCF